MMTFEQIKAGYYVPIKDSDVPCCNVCGEINTTIEICVMDDYGFARDAKVCQACFNILDVDMWVPEKHWVMVGAKTPVSQLPIAEG